RSTLFPYTTLFRSKTGDHFSGTCSDSQIGLDAGGLARDVGARDHIDDATALHDVVPNGQALREAEVLLYQQDRVAFLAHQIDRAADLLHDHRRETLGRLVEQKQA